MNDYDVAVIGGSAAGLSAALVLSRARRRVLVMDSGAPRNGPAAHLQGFLSRDGVSPAEFVKIGRDEVHGYGGQLIDGTVLGIVPNGQQGFWLLLDDGRRLPARRVVVATGLRDVLPPVSGLRERWAIDVLHCPYCHGWEVRDRQLGVLGGTPDAVRYAQIVRQWSKDVVLFTPHGALTTAERSQLLARAIGLVEGTVSEVVLTDDHLSGVRMDDGRIVPRDAVFVPPRFEPNTGLLVDLGCDLDEQGWPTTDPTGQTSIRGVWVAGNAVNPRAQVITAAGEGSAVAISVNADLVDEDIQRALRDFNLGLPA